ncbi:hypothetical protein ABZS66_56215 [Dactylosporangium sp. NPDC005572]|uniref:hypothetical protein n=1 Tax=Dactylosporangium sp. NPDC005572 TaxID=3156889 RepID=UPI0033AF6C7C
MATTAATRDRTGCPAAAPVTATTASTIRLTADERGKLATLPGNAVLLVVHNTLTGQELGHTTPRDHRGHMLVYVAAARHLTHISASNRCPNFTAAIR